MPIGSALLQPPPYSHYPKEIEEVLLEMDDIIDAQVVGLPDKRYGEEIVAYIRTKVVF